jgi:hypothetical protein
VQLQLLSGKTGAVVEVELLRADAEEVKLHRALSDWLAHIRDNSTSGLDLPEAPLPSCHVALYSAACVLCLVCACQCMWCLVHGCLCVWCLASVELLAVNIMLHVSGLTRKARALAGGGLFAHEGTSTKNAAAADHVMSILTALQVVYACEGGALRRVHWDKHVKIACSATRKIACTLSLTLLVGMHVKRFGGTSKTQRWQGACMGRRSRCGRASTKSTCRWARWRVLTTACTNVQSACCRRWTASTLLVLLLQPARTPLHAQIASITLAS